MTDNVKQFIEENIDLIEFNNFDELFRRANLDLADCLEIGELSKILEDAEIYPLNYLNYVPDHYMYGTDIEIFAPRVGIKYICNGAFRFCDNLISIDLPEGTKVIYSHAFEDCPNIKELNLPSSLRQIDSTAFLDSLDHPDLLAHAPYPSYANEWLNKHIYS